jgi:predicted RNA-binding protein YlxR (DUF448 family)
MAKRGHISVRMCAGCRKRRPKAELIRLTLNDQGQVVVDKEKLSAGRGVYLCPSQGCLELAIKKKGITRGFRDRSRQVVLEEVSSVFREEREWRK